jgi:TonB family protein
MPSSRSMNPDRKSSLRIAKSVHSVALKSIVHPSQAAFCILVFSVYALPFALAQRAPSSPPKQSGKPKAAALYAPPPKYPKDVQGYRPRGSGIVVMEIDKKTGLVKLARMEKSTGNKLLDDAALQAFSQWRFKPGSASRIHCPITFWHNGSVIRHRMAGAVIAN